MDFYQPGTIQNPSVMSYCLAVLSDREHVTLHQLEHPEYDTEEEYGLILEAWLAHRDRWTRENKDRGEFLPKPKRRPGRPVNQQALERKQRAEEDRLARRKAAEERKAERERRAEEDRLARAARLEEERLDKEQRTQRLARRAATSGAIVLTMKLPEDVLVGLAQVKGDLTMADCIVELLRHALGPLCDKEAQTTATQDSHTATESHDRS